MLISIDSLRADHLGSYGYGENTSPNIDILAADSVVFERALSTTTWTLPAHVSMITGLYPETHGVMRDRQRLGQEAVTVAESLRQAGYRTAAIVSAPYLNRQFGYNQGFDLYDDETSIVSHRESHRLSTAMRTEERAVEFVEKAGDEPFFLFLHFWDVHYDYTPPPPFDERFDPGYDGSVTAERFEFSSAIHPGMDPRDLEHVIALYDGEIAFTDMVLGRFLDYLRSRGTWDDTLVVFTADHGDEFFEHDHKGHRHNLYQATLRVPLIVKFPDGQWSNERVAETVSIVDIVPTILRVSNLDVGPEIAGVPLQELIEAGDDLSRLPRPIFASLRDLKSVVVGSRKLIVRWEARLANLTNPVMRTLDVVVPLDHRPTSAELYELEIDPGEHRDIAMKRPTERAEMIELLDRWLTLARRQGEHLGGEDFEYSDELTRSLRALGYVR